MEPIATIVIPAFRNPSLRETLVSILQADTGSVETEVIVVLNGATGEVRSIATEFDGAVRIAEVPVNLGVSGAFNHGFSLGRGAYLVQMQDDARVEPGWLEPLVEAVDSAADIAAAGALNINRRGEVRDAGWVIWRDGTTSPGLVNGSLDPNSYRERRSIDQHGSAGMLITRTAWESVGGLDDTFYPAYYGDVDFCWRLRRRGWRILIEPRSRVHHTGSESTALSFREFLLERNHQIFFERHASTLTDHGERSYDPADVTREVMRAGACPPGPEPPPAGDPELAALAGRVSLAPLEIARRERETWIAFGAFVDARREEEEALREGERQQAQREIRRLNHEISTIRSNAEMTERHLATRLEMAEARTHRVVTSRTWRFTAPVRALAARFRALRDRD